MILLLYDKVVFLGDHRFVAFDELHKILIRLPALFAFHAASFDIFRKQEQNKYIHRYEAYYYDRGARGQVYT